MGGRCRLYRRHIVGIDRDRLGLVRFDRRFEGRWRRGVSQQVCVFEIIRWFEEVVSHLETGGGIIQGGDIKVCEVCVGEHGKIFIKVELISGKDIMVKRRSDRVQVVEVFREVWPCAAAVARHPESSAVCCQALDRWTAKLRLSSVVHSVAANI